MLKPARHIKLIKFFMPAAYPAQIVFALGGLPNFVGELRRRPERLIQ
jgi:hypothetical protein